MSGSSQGRITVGDIQARKGGEDAIVCLTAYTTPMARLVDRHVDLILVGDSVGMVVYGLESTVGVTLDMMAAHGAAVGRGATRACTVVDLPFASYQESPQAAFRAAARLMAETGCQAVKLEGGTEMAETVRFLCERGIPVMGHVGLTPQHINRFGGFRVQGRSDEGARRVLDDARSVAEAGAFSVVVEAVPAGLAADITAAIAVPTIGIGAGPSCDGQILVTEDILGLFADFKPRFVKRFAELGGQIDAAIGGYADAVRSRAFPDDAHSFATKAAARKT